MAETVPEILLSVTYLGKNISRDISANLLSFSYTDNVKDKADEIEIELDDTDGKWRNEWAVKKKDTISAAIGYEGNMLNCGEFEVDEKEMDGPPFRYKIRAVATGVSNKMRTKNSKAHEGKTLKQIAQSICDAHGLTLDVGTHVETAKDVILADIDAINEIRMAVFKLMELEEPSEQSAGLIEIGPKVGAVVKSMKAKSFSPEPEWTQSAWFFVSHHYTKPGLRYLVDRLLQVENKLHARRYEFRTNDQTKKVANNLDIVISRTTQANETDLAFLSRIAAEYGFAFNIKGKYMIFYNIAAIKGRPASVKLGIKDLIRVNIKDKVSVTYEDAEVTSHNPKKKEVVKAVAKAYEQPLYPMQAVKPAYRPVGYGVLVSQGQQEKPTDQAEKESYGGDTLKIKTKTENKQQAEAKAQTALSEANSNCCSGSIETPLNILLCGGNNVELTELGEFSGVYHIASAVFNYQKGSGATTGCEIQRVGFVPLPKKKKKDDDEDF